MRLSDEQEESGFSPPVLYTIIAVSAFVLIILACVLVSNNREKSLRQKHQKIPEETQVQAEEQTEETAESAEGQKDIETLYKEHKLRSEDLDFWDMYDGQEAETVTVLPEESPSPTPSHEPTDEEKAADGKHVLVSYRDGTKEWLAIDEKLPLHSYDFTKMKATNGKMVYYDGNKKISRLGISLSEENGDVDFAAVKESGVDFVMLKAGARGYESGLLTADEKFTVNAEAALEAGLKIGVYFCSQAVTVEEAVQEA